MLDELHVLEECRNGSQAIILVGNLHFHRFTFRNAQVSDVFQAFGLVEVFALNGSDVAVWEMTGK